MRSGAWEAEAYIADVTHNGFPRESSFHSYEPKLDKTVIYQYHADPDGGGATVPFRLRRFIDPDTGNVHAPGSRRDEYELDHNVVQVIAADGPSQPPRRGPNLGQFLGKRKRPVSTGSKGDGKGKDPAANPPGRLPENPENTKRNAIGPKRKAARAGVDGEGNDGCGDGGAAPPGVGGAE